MLVFCVTHYAAKSTWFSCFCLVTHSYSATHYCHCSSHAAVIVSREYPSVQPTHTTYYRTTKTTSNRVTKYHSNQRSVLGKQDRRWQKWRRPTIPPVSLPTVLLISLHQDSPPLSSQPIPSSPSQFKPNHHLQ